MRIRYDAASDAAYIYLSDKVHLPDTREVDEDIYLDFDGENRLVGIEVLDASKRLKLDVLHSADETQASDGAKAGPRGKSSSRTGL